MIADIILLFVVGTLGLVVCSYMLYQFKKEIAFFIHGVDRGIRFLIKTAEDITAKRRKKGKANLGVAS